MRPVFLALLMTSTAAAQYVIDRPRAERLLAAHAGDRPLHCDVIPVPANFIFSFRFQTGYLVRMPLKQYAGQGHHWNILMRVTPAGGAGPPFLRGRTPRRN